MEAWSLIFSILSFIVACFSLWAMIKIAIATSNLEKDRSSLFAEILKYVKSMAPEEKQIDNEKSTKKDELTKTSSETDKKSMEEMNKNLKEIADELNKENEKK